MEAVRWVIAIPHDSILTFCCTVKINRQFQSLTRDLPTLQYQRDLFAGLIENPRDPCDFVQPQKLCEEHERKWSSVGRVVKTIHELPKEMFSGLRSTENHSGGVIASLSQPDNSIGVLRIPPVTSRKPIEWWNIPPFPFYVGAFVMYPPDNILAVAMGTVR